MACVLCVDDDERSLLLRMLVLEARGYRALAATDGVSALRLLDEHAVDTVVLDYRMSPMDGEAVAMAIRERSPNLPIIILTGNPGQVPERVLWAVDGCIAKGEPVNVLLQALASVIMQAAATGIPA